MKKLQRLFAILLCLSMVLGMAPMIRSAAAEATHAAHGSHEGWTPVSGELTADKLSGNVVLNGPATIASTVTIEANKTVHLCLNGQTVTVADGVQALVINGSLELCDCAGGGKIAGNVSTAFTGEGLVDVNGGATLNMHGGTISGGYGTGRAGGVCVSGTFLMDGGEITGCKGKNGGAIFSEGTTTITGSAKIHGNTATATSGAIRINGGTTTISGGEIYENSTPATGGAIWINGGTLNMTGGTIRGNSASNAGAIYIPTGAMVMSGGLIAENTMANTNCGGVYVNGGSFTMTDGELRDNSNQSLRGDAGTVAISGSAVIDMVRPNGATFSLKNFTEGASVYATAAIDHDATVAAAEEELPYHYTYKASGSQEPSTPGGEEPTVPGGEEDSSHEGWTPVSGELTADKLSGNVVLNGPATIASTVTIEANKTVRLCLNGQTVTVADGVQALVINGSLELCDCAGGGKIAGNVSTAFTGEGLVDVNGGATFTMHGGTISGGYGTGRAGGVCVSGTFLMDGGEITGCKGKNGGAIFSEGTTTITGSAKIHGNTATATSGAIRINGGTTTISGGEIYENSTPATGGAIWINGGTLNMTGGTIRGNSASNAGAIYIPTGAMVMSGGLIAENTMANTNCGGVYVNGGSFTMTGGELSQNSNQSLRADTGTVTISGSSVIDHVKPNGATMSIKELTEGASIYAEATISYDNTVAAAEEQLPYHYTYKAGGGEEPSNPGGEEDPTTPGGEVDPSHEGWTALNGNVSAIPAGKYNLTGDVKLTQALTIEGDVELCLNGCTITGSAAPYFTVSDGATLTICDCSEEGTGKLDGSGLGKTSVAGLVNVAVGGTFVLESGEITGHETGTRTGGVIVFGTFKMNGGKITNCIGVNGGAMFVEGGVFEMTGGEISGNSAVTTAGAIRLNPGSTATISGGTISGNKAPAGGAFYTVAGSTLNLTGGSITGNTGLTEAGAMTVCGTFNMTGGEISGNTAPVRGAITGAGCIFNMSGGKIVDNGSAPAVRLADSGTTGSVGTITGSAIIDQGGISTSGEYSSITIKELVKGASVYGASALTVGDKTVHVALDPESGLTLYTWNKPASNGMHIETAAGAIEGNKLVVSEDATSSVQLVAKFDVDVPTLVPNYKLVWASSNEKVATVSDTGVLTYKGYGSAKITVEVRDAQGQETDYYTFVDVQVGENPLRILAIGNELSREYMYYLGQLGLLTDTHIQAAYLSADNASLRDHAYNMAAGSIAYSYYKTDLQTGKLIACEDTSVAAALLEEEWDVILLQHSITAVGWTTTYNSDLEYLIDYFHGEEPNAKVYWTMTWALEDGFSGSSGHGFDFGFRYDNSQKLMFNAIVDSMDKYIVGAESRFGSELEGYVPVGAAIQNLRAVRGDTLSRDGYLLSLEAGRLTAALTLLETLAPNADLSKITATALSGILEEKDMDGQETVASAADAYVNNEASLKQVKTAVAAACQTASEGKLPETFEVEAAATSSNADQTVAQVVAPLGVRFPNMTKLSDGTIIVSVTEHVDHATTIGLGNMQEGSARIVYFTGRENSDGTITWNYDEPLLVIDEDWLEEKGIATVSDRYARIKENPSIASSVTVATAFGDTNLEIAYIDMDGDGDKEEVLLTTYWGYIMYQNGSHKKAGYVMYSLDSGKTWSDPYYVTTKNGPMLKYGNSAMFNDGQILMPYYGQYKGAVLIEWSVEQQNWVQLADYEITLDMFDEYTQNESTEFNEIALVSPDGSDTVYAMVRASGAIMRSHDRGKTWEQIGNEPGLCGQPGFIILDKDHVFVTWVNQGSSPRDIYGKLFNVKGDWTDYPAVKIYASPDRSAHDTADPAAALLSDGRIVVLSYDTAYRSIVGNYVDPYGEEFQPLELDTSIENFELSELESGSVTLGEHMLEEAIPGSHTINAKVQFTSANGTVTIHTPNGTLTISAQEYNLAANVSTNIVASIVGSDAYVKVWQTTEPEEYTIESLTALAADAQAKSGISGQDAKLEAFNVSKRIIVELQSSLTGVPLAPDAQLSYSINPVQTDVSWHSSNENVASVSDTGVVHFGEPGTADIILTVCGKEFVCKVTVNEQPAELTGKGETTVFVDDDFSGYGTGDDAFWNAYWADPDSSEYWVNIAKDAKDPGLKYNIKEENGNKYLEIHSMGAASWLMNKEVITGDYTVQYDFRFYTLHFNSPSDRMNTMPWQVVDENGKTSNGVNVMVNLRQEGFQFYNGTVNPVEQDNHYGLYERGVWTTVKIVRTNGALYVKIWPAGTEEPEAWSGILFDDVIDTSLPSHYRMQFAPKSGWEGKFDMDNLMISQQVEDTSAVTVNFNSDGGSDVAAQTVKIGDKLTVPTAPTKEGYTFIGWYYGMNAWDFDTDTVQAPMTLTAKWEANAPSGGEGTGGEGTGNQPDTGDSVPVTALVILLLLSFAGVAVLLVFKKKRV